MTAETCTGVGRTDKQWERNPDEKECSGGADVEVFRVRESDTGNVGRICAGNICVWWRESGGGMETTDLICSNNVTSSTTELVAMTLHPPCWFCDNNITSSVPKQRFYGKNRGKRG